jgi:hypothetical protein
MKENTVWILTYILLVAAFAYVIGWVSGGLFPPAENLLAFLAAGPLVREHFTRLPAPWPGSGAWKGDRGVLV